MPRAKPCANGDGRKAVRKGLCRPCYNDAPHAPRAKPGEGTRLDVLHVPASWARAVEAAAERRGVTVAQWRRDAIRAALLQQGWVDPVVRTAVQNALEPS